ncbi:MAG: hypothetical protein CFE21_01015 [Bacteroidetes bacterium B1(2017)]|nr:MAG: hypothetical protein CFE21_01015 [Bacteroidetes bacterium B1(2017)]
MRYKIVGFVFLVCMLNQSLAQQKDINQHVQVWISANNTFQLNKHWQLLADAHARKTIDNRAGQFYLLRAGALYQFTPKISVAAGYAHAWIAPSQLGWTTFGNENRLYQQVTLSDKFMGSNLSLRFRNEQRLTELIVADKKTGTYRFVNRARLLVNFLIPLSSNPMKPELLVANEVMLNLGKDVTYNTFDQNRTILGIRQKINTNWSYDLAYMLIYQQKQNGLSYDLNHTLRLFFYGNFGTKISD